MITWTIKNLNGEYGGKGLSKDVATLPITGEEIKNGTEFYVMDEPISPVTSKLYMFDGENKVWLAQ